MKEKIDRKEELFFSFVLPAYNEEKYIEKTVEALKRLDYSKEKLEVIIVENGSTDRTREVTKSIIPKEFKFVSLKEAGVSRAKNKGISLVYPSSDWVIFLDADTILKGSLLRDLNNYLNSFADGEFVAGTTSVLPASNPKVAKGWFEFYNFAHWLTKTSYSLQFARRDLLSKIKFDEELQFGEDTKFLKEIKKHGKFFFFKTDKVFTSTRRFDAYGYFKLLLIWISYASKPYNLKKLIRYKAVR